ncbi:hypothetical protein AAFF_G00105540 [Aldrovandia affinis]|uniref:Uncharacterized protein n=1 Tax=Aldrovandia affinis TaxID=143900 RepID=A0AAD7T381_9TELE|nr:hypothetical protein AAFF_G00105540 [Aldrovandia affinis]
MEDLKVLDDLELDGVCRLQEPDEFEGGGDWTSTEAAGLRSRKTGSGESLMTRKAEKSQLSRLEDGDGQYSGLDSLTFDDKLPWIPGEGSSPSAVTPPNTKVRKPVSACGILALTQSPMLYKGKRKTDRNCRDESEPGSHVHKMAEGEPESPFNRPTRRQAPSRTYSRKRLLD